MTETHRRKPFWGLSKRSWALYRSVWLGWRAFDRVAFRNTPHGVENVPSDGPVLLLANHVGLLDPFWVGINIWRPCRFMAATSVFKIPVLGPVLGGLGAFPKMKYVKDRESMRKLAEHYDAGHVVMLFPEGVRTWTGQPMPVLPGIGRLIKRMNARVVYARIDSGYLVAPRWAKYPRYVPLDITYDGPHTYPADWSAERITEDVREKLHVEPKRDPSRFAWGYRLAEGLPTLLWACPACLDFDALEVPRRDGDRVTCRSCGATWRVDLDAQLNGEGGAETMSVPEAAARLRAHIGDPAALDRARFEADGVVGEAEVATITRVQYDGPPSPPMTGRLVVTSEELRIEPIAGEPWRARFEDVLSVSTEVGDQLLIRLPGETRRGRVFRLDVAGQSPLKWGAVLFTWYRHHHPMS